MCLVFLAVAFSAMLERETTLLSREAQIRDAILTLQRSAHDPYIGYRYNNIRGGEIAVANAHQIRGVLELVYLWQTAFEARKKRTLSTTVS
jgi:hypothetical protein